MGKLMYLWFAVKTVFCTCQTDHKKNGFDKVRSQYKITKIGKLPAIVNESSGLALGDKPNTFWTHNDGGGKSELYQINEKGTLLSVLPIAQAQNVDWEDLTQDQSGNLYIGDFGNNGNARKDLGIYKVKLSDSSWGKINFRYADQTQFPPSPENFIYDGEAIFHHEQSLYVIAKNWTKQNRYVRMYRIPDQPGDYNLTPVDSIPIKTQVTSADISPDGKTFALLTYGKILFFDIDQGTINFKKPQGCFKIMKKQAEALIFLNNKDLMLTNEQGQIYRVTRH